MIIQAVGSELAKQLIGQYLIPKIDQFIQNEDFKNEICKDIQEKFEVYLTRSFNKHIYMDTIVFKNQQKHIDELYIPLTILKTTEVGVSEKIVVNGLNKDFLEKYKKVLLVDTAGMGKSTLLKYLFISCIRENGGIPILIELRKLNSEDSILDYILNELNGTNGEIDRRYLQAVIERGDFMIFLDGYDEIDEELKSSITTKLEDFSSEADNNIFIMSSREESSLSCFGDFQRFTIQNLSKEEAFALIRKYDKQGKYADLLIQKLEEERNLQIIQEFLANPLMVSLLYKAFEYKEYIPYKKHLFYRQVYNALFEDHDMTKGGHFIHKKNSGLDIEDFHRITRCIGYLTALKGKVSLTRDEFRKVIEKAIQLTPAIKTSANNMIKDLVKVVPLFVEDGLEYRWTHKSFQDYFAAAYICDDLKINQRKVWEKLIEIDAEKYFNILDFCYDMDVKNFRSYIILPLINDYINYYENTYTDVYFLNNFSKEELEQRKTVEFLWKNIYINLNTSLVKGESKTITNEEYELFFKNYKVDVNGLGRKRSCVWGNHLGIAAVEGNRIALLKLLSNKNEKVVESLRPKIRLGNILAQLTDGEYYLDENKNNLLNTKENFVDITNILLNTLWRTNILSFNYEECIRLQQEILNVEKLEEIDVLELLFDK